jgi:D-glycero-alpha-D-manno-heptose-7-phosphate kinase
MSEILNRGWALKTRLASKITNPQIDAWYEAAIAAGASSGKIVGAGGGGFLLLYRDEKYKEAIGKALPELKESSFTFEPQGSKIIYVSE